MNIGWTGCRFSWIWVISDPALHGETERETLMWDGLHRLPTWYTSICEEFLNWLFRALSAVFDTTKKDQSKSTIGGLLLITSLLRCVLWWLSRFLTQQTTWSSSGISQTLSTSARRYNFHRWNFSIFSNWYFASSIPMYLFPFISLIFSFSKPNSAWASACEDRGLHNWVQHWILHLLGCSI